MNKKKKGMYYTPKEIIDPASGSGAFLKDAADYVLSNPPYAAQHQMQRTACTHPEKKIIGAIPYCKVCGEQLD